MSPLHVLVVLAAFSGEPAGEVLDFSATYCGPCRAMTPIVARLEREGLPIRQIDIEQHRDLADQYHITRIPTFILVINGEEAERVVGPLSESDLRRMCARIPDPAEPQVVRTSNPPQPRAGVSQPLAVTVPEEKKEPSPASKFFDMLRGKRGDEQSTVRGNSDELTSAPQPAAATNDPMKASVRIRASVNGEISFGSGTIVHSEPGRTLIVTCGHIFRNMNDAAKIEVDLFENGKPQPYVASIVDYDLEADVGLLRIPTHSVVSSTPVAPPTVVLTKSQRVGCIGCSGGAEPTREQLTITAVNKYDGPDNIECTGTPVQGRSGGGLFNVDGQLVGVCIAAVKEEPLGVYAHVFAVHKLLERNGLQTLYQPESVPEDSLLADTPTEAPPAEFPADLGVASPASEPAPAPTATDLIAVETEPASTATATPTDLAGVMADVQAGDAEVVVIIRSKSQPNAESRVVIINRASPKFLAYLNGEIRPAGLAANRPAPQSPGAAGDRSRDERFARAPRGPQSVQAQTQPVSFHPMKAAAPQSAVERSLSRRMTEARRLTTAAK